MNHIKIYILLLFLFILGCTHNRYTNHFQSIDSGELQFFPETYSEKPESLPLLVEALRDPDWLVYNEAAVGLSRLPSEKIIPRMKELLKDPGSRVRSNAQWVIKKIER